MSLDLSRKPHPSQGYGLRDNVLTSYFLVFVLNLLARRVSQALFLHQSKAGGGNGLGTRLTDLLRARARRYLQFLCSHAPPHMTFFAEVV